MELIKWCPDCKKGVIVKTLETADEIIKICGECQLSLSSEKKSEEIQPPPIKNEERLIEEDVCVFGVVLGDFNRILLKKNPQEPKAWGTKPEGWGRPGGVKKPEESEVEALFREIEEETGFLVEIKEETRHVERKGNHLDVSYICSVYGGKQKSGCNWFSLDCLPRNTYPFHRKIILLLTGSRKQN